MFGGSAAKAPLPAPPSVAARGSGRTVEDAGVQDECIARYSASHCWLIEPKAVSFFALGTRTRIRPIGTAAMSRVTMNNSMMWRPFAPVRTDCATCQARCLSSFVQARCSPLCKVESTMHQRLDSRVC